MTEQQEPSAASSRSEDQVVVIGPDGQPIGTIPASALAGVAAAAADDDDGDGERHITELVEQPAKVMRIGSMIRQLLEEVKAAPLDEASRSRLKEIHAASIKELESGLAPELVEELERLSLPFTEDGVPRPRASCGSPRPSSSAGSRASSTASRPRSTPSRWPLARPARADAPRRCPPGASGPGGPGARAPARQRRTSRRDSGGMYLWLSGDSSPGGTAGPTSRVPG